MLGILRDSHGDTEDTETAVTEKSHPVKGCR